MTYIYIVHLQYSAYADREWEPIVNLQNMACIVYKFKSILFRKKYFENTILFCNWKYFSGVFYFVILKILCLQYFILYFQNTF